MERSQTFGKQVQTEPERTNWTQQIDLCNDVGVDISDIGDIEVETYDSDEDEDDDDTSFGSDDDDEDCVVDVDVDDSDEGLMNSPISKYKEFKVVNFEEQVDKSDYELDTADETATGLNKFAHQIALKRLSYQNVTIESCPNKRSLSGHAGLSGTEKSCEKSNHELDGGYETDLSTPAYLVALNELSSQDVLIEPGFPKNASKPPNNSFQHELNELSTPQGMPPGPKSSNTILVNCLLNDSNKPIGANHVTVPCNFHQSELTDPSTIQAGISESELIQPMCTQSALSNLSTIQPRAADTEFIQPRSTDFLHNVPRYTQSQIQAASATSTGYRKPDDPDRPVITPVLHFIGNGKTTLKPSKIDKRKSFCLICKRNIFSCHRFSHPWAPKKILLCGHCNTDFPFIRFVQAHFRNIHEEHYKYFCDICHRALRPEELSSHLQKHQSPAYQCGVCKSDFTEFQELQTHLEIHKKKILYKCGICMMNFEETNELKKHFDIHFPGYFECEICKERRKTRYNLIRHMNSKHGQALVSTNASIQTFDYQSHDHTDPEESDLDKMEVPPSCSNTGYGQKDNHMDVNPEHSNIWDSSNHDENAVTQMCKDMDGPKDKEIDVKPELSNITDSSNLNELVAFHSCKEMGAAPKYDQINVKPEISISRDTSNQEETVAHQMCEEMGAGPNWKLEDAIVDAYEDCQNDEQFDECNDSDNINDPSNDHEIVDAHRKIMNQQMDYEPVLDLQTQLNNDLRWVMHHTMK